VALLPLLKRMASLENISKFMRQTVIEEYIWSICRLRVRKKEAINDLQNGIQFNDAAYFAAKNNPKVALF
jgi:hypothetical protein